MEIPEKILKGRRALDGISHFYLMQDWNWDDQYEVWYIKFSIQLETNNFGSKTYWVAITEKNYPNSYVGIYPNKGLGIEDTYPHQTNNGLHKYGCLCKSGKICLDNPMDEQYEKNLDEDTLLLWHVQRLIEWIEKADNNDLLQNGDYFEMPEFNIKSKATLVAYDC